MQEAEIKHMIEEVAGILGTAQGMEQGFEQTSKASTYEILMAILIYELRLKRDSSHSMGFK